MQFDQLKRRKFITLLGGAAAAGKIVGIASGDEQSVAVARSGQGVAGLRASRSDLRLVHRGLRHARSEGSQGLAQYAGVMTVRSALRAAGEGAQVKYHVRVGAGWCFGTSL